MKKILLAVLCAFIACGCVSKGARTVKKYDNDLTAVLIHNNDSLAASVTVFVRAGAVDEKPSQAGLSHFLEHLMFKGSENYPGDELSRRVENMGGYINAATSKEYTVYYINIQKDGVEETIKMLADVMQNPLLPKDDIDRERKVVIEEIQRHSDNPHAVLYENFFQSIYEESALKNSIIGTADVIANVSRDEIYEYYSAHYVPEKMVVVVSGNFDKKKTQKLIDKTFGKFQKRTPPADPVTVEKVHTGKDWLKHDKVEVGYLVSGFLGPDITSDDIFIADLAMSVLGGGKTSRLYRVLKDEKRLVYSIGSAFMTVKGTGVAYISAVFAPENLDAIKAEIKRQVENIIENGIEEEELNRSKLAFKTSWNFSHETPFDIAHNVGYWTLMGRPDAIDGYMPRIEALTAEDVRNFFVKYFSADRMTTAALLPNAKAGK
ncbi:MAG: insulinase family protein [Endomicrobia bacterium]|nr:insulinase family protein [Endomicrobiia bacterium]MCL2506142.1 insulinase family protein [Endomicrobiia bacterium]